MSRRKMAYFGVGDTVFPLCYRIPHTSRHERKRYLMEAPASGPHVVVGMEYVYIGVYVPSTGYREDCEQGYISNAERVLLYQIRPHNGCMTDPVRLMLPGEVVGSIRHPHSIGMPIYPSGQKWSEEEKANMKRWFKTLEERGLIKRDAKGRFVK